MAIFLLIIIRDRLLFITLFLLQQQHSALLFSLVIFSLFIDSYTDNYRYLLAPVSFAVWKTNMTNNFYQQKENFFNLWAPYYDCLLTTIFYQSIHQRLLEYVELTENASVLDLGCGTGKLISRLASEFPTMRGIGLDLSPSMLLEARARNQYRDRLIFVSGRAESLSFADEQFDAVFCTMSFLHYPHPQQVFNQVKRVLAKGGRFYLADAYRREHSFASFIPGIGEMRLYTRQQREQLGTEADLSCLAHHHLLPGILLTIFSTHTEQS